MLRNGAGWPIDDGMDRYLWSVGERATVMAPPPITSSRQMRRSPPFRPKTSPAFFTLTQGSRESFLSRGAGCRRVVKSYDDRSLIFWRSSLGRSQPYSSCQVIHVVTDTTNYESRAGGFQTLHLASRALCDRRHRRAS